ncbi:lytic polysaccharide monooxygenase auxiliary activity family 9 protein [Pseudomonas putida]|uniref:lytic polysaccharide monooxygenase auxiliary activity family 9 protein n=1 Tax=Pseudomonas putida TaxID=303 RepID=UPI0018AAC355|nr:lytic polysaccharide monooxygenase auxiliary activity family 9 protein [Pseudomonas putida]MBF8658556.1 lytic polysaccharide monooxygenase [Pseudomonas putida]
MTQKNQPSSPPITPAHGGISKPESRAFIAEKNGKIEGNLQYGIEGGKFFPATQGGLLDPDAKDDVRNIAPPADGQIASAQRPGAAYLDTPGQHWDKHQVKSGSTLDFTWAFSAQHKYRRFNYFITKAGWDFNKPLARDAFEATPFATFLNPHQPYWGYGEREMWPGNPTVHNLQLPEREGYHVLLGVWEIAETDKAFYQVVDLDFIK